MECRKQTKSFRIYNQTQKSTSYERISFEIEQDRDSDQSSSMTQKNTYFL